MKQKIIFNKDALQQILEGVDIAANVVKVTLGPKGNNVISHVIQGGVRSTKDGVSALNEVRPDNQLQNAGVKILRQAAQKTADEAGDSTTSTTILAQSMMHDVYMLLNKGKSSVELRKGIEKATEKCVEWIKENAIPINGNVEKIRAIATISANNNYEIGNLIAGAFAKLGEHGEITLEDSQSDKSYMETLGGYYFKRGFISPYFITNPIKGTCELEEPLILLYDKKISKVVDLLAVLEYSIQMGNRPLLIICHSCESEALGTLITNKVHKGLRVCVVYAPEGGIKRADMMEDIAIFTGGKMISEDQGTSLDKQNFKPEYLGAALKVIVKKESCLIVNGQGNPDLIEKRQRQIKEMISEAPSEYEKEYLRIRAGSIGKGVAILYIGAATELERGDKKDLAEDAILSTRSAIDEGFLPGGGIGFLRCAQHLKYLNLKSSGTDVVINALHKPLEQLLIIGDLMRPNKSFLEKIFNKKNKIKEKIINGIWDYGYNAKTEELGNLIPEGVIDAAKVIRCAIENASSVSSQFCTTKVLISEISD